MFSRETILDSFVPASVSVMQVCSFNSSGLTPLSLADDNRKRSVISMETRQNFLGICSLRTLRKNFLVVEVSKNRRLL